MLKAVVPGVHIQLEPMQQTFWRPCYLKSIVINKVPRFKPTRFFSSGTYCRQRSTLPPCHRRPQARPLLPYMRACNDVYSSLRSIASSCARYNGGHGIAYWSSKDYVILSCSCHIIVRGVHTERVGYCLRTAASRGPIIHPPSDI
jgi:hypothetical protein